MLPSSSFSEGTGPIILDNVMCTGVESRLVDCRHAGLEVNTCSHSQDAGVLCRSGKWHSYLMNIF